MLGSLGRSALVTLAAAMGVAGLSASPAFAAAINVPGGDTFASGSADQSLLENGGGTRIGLGSDWSGLISTWRKSPSATQHWEYTPPVGQPYVTPTYQLTGNPSITFTPTSESAAFNEFATPDSKTVGKVDPTQDPVADAQDPPVLDGLVASDDAPSQDQMQAAAFAASSRNVTETSVPIAQTPLALLFSLPSGITLAGGARIPLINNVQGDNWSTLQAIFDRKIDAFGGYPANSWGALLKRTGLTPITSGAPTAQQFLDTGSASAHTGGYQPLQLEVRHGDAAETEAIQTFLSFSGDQTFARLPSGGDWVPSEAEARWPADANDGAGANGYPAGPLGANSEGTTLVKNTLATPGTIGYATMPDAVYTVAGAPFEGAPQSTTYHGSTAHQYLFAAVQSDEWESSGTRHYAEPGQVTTNSNGSLQAIPNLYTGSATNNAWFNPASNSGVGAWGWYNADSGYGNAFYGAASDPDVYGDSAPTWSSGPPVNAYPISEVTWLTAWTRYAGNLSGPDFYASAANATDTGNTVAAYLNWVTKPTGGQAALQSAKVGWEELPSVNVQGIAQLFASEIATPDVGYQPP